MTNSSVSIVSILKPAWCSSAPMSWTCVNGEMCAAIPPLRSISASCNDDLSSNRVSPPKIDAKNTPSGRRLLIIDRKHPGKSLTQCRLRFDITISKEFSSNFWIKESFSKVQLKISPWHFHRQQRRTMPESKRAYLWRFFVHVKSGDFISFWFWSSFGLFQGHLTGVTQIEVFDAVG